MNSTAILQRLFILQYDYTDPIKRNRAQLLLYILGIGTALGIIALLQITVLPLISGTTVGLTDYINAVPFLTNLLMVYLIQTGRFTLASVLVVGVATMIAVVVSLLMPVSTTPLFNIYLLPLALAVLVFDRWQFNITASIVLVIIIATGMINHGGLSGLLESSSGTGLLLHLVIASVLSISSGGLNDIAKVNQEAIQKYDDISQYAANMPMVSENHVLGRMLDLVRRDMNYAFAQVFLADQHGQINRRFRTGLNLPEGGVFSDVRLVDASALVESLRSNIPVLVSTQDNTARWEHFLPATQFGLILPIQIGEQIIGVLDIQKTDLPFSSVEVKTLQRLIQHTATFTIYSRALDDFRVTVDNLRQSVTSLQGQLREYKQAEGDVVGATWMSYLDKRNQDTLGYDLKPNGITLASDLPEDVAATMKGGEIDVRIENDRRIVRAPILVRSEVLGALVFDMPQERGFGPRQVDFMQSVTARLALALENRRLFEESRSQAQREQKANEVTSLLLGATDVNEVLKLAADSFNTALGAVATRIHVDRQALEFEPATPSTPRLLNDGDQTS